MPPRTASHLLVSGSDMRIQTVRLREFKRFTNTTVSQIPETAKLVIIAGPNGCGKSSFFEGLNVWSRKRYYNVKWEQEYYAKKVPEPEIVHANQAVDLILHDYDSIKIDARKAVYIRSAHRNDPEFRLQSLQNLGPATEENRLERIILNDATVSRNYQRLTSQAMEDMFENADGAMTLEEFRDVTIGEIRDATRRLFPDLIMNSLGNPLSEGMFRFDKGISKAFGYQNLSGGEKAAFDLILDLIVKRREYDNTIFCIDEPEAHMNSRLQGALLDELYRLITGQSQLWLATHSAGMMRRARDIEREHPGTVVFIDFGGRNFDDPVEITPEKPSRVFWERVLDVAFDDFANLMAPMEVIICEGSRIGTGGKNEGMDAKIYEEIFSADYPDTRFMNGGGVHEVEADRLALIQAMHRLVKGTTVRRLIDRDDRNDNEISELRRQGIAVLNRRNLECYLYDDEVISALYESKGKLSALIQYTEFKNEELRKAAEQRGRAPDDVKAISGTLNNRIRRDLSLTQMGNTPKAFALSILVPHIYETKAYEELRSSIFIEN
ncbi:MAG: AAA family ATPase [Pseudomonadota bacterium]